MMGTNPWTYILLFIVVIVGAIVIIGVLLGLITGFAGSRFAEKTQSKYRKQIADMLPGNDCGACGFECCISYADAVLHNLADEDLCPHGAKDLPDRMTACRKKLLELMEDPTPPKVRESAGSIWDQKS